MDLGREAPPAGWPGALRNTLYSDSDTPSARLPFDAETELSVLAECADPLHGAVLPGVTSDDFFDRRNARIHDAIALGDLSLLSDADRHYLAGAVKYAFPVTSSTIPRFVDLARRRRRLLELEREREELLAVP